MRREVLGLVGCLMSHANSGCTGKPVPHLALCRPMCTDAAVAEPHLLTGKCDKAEILTPVQIFVLGKVTVCHLHLHQLSKLWHPHHHKIGCARGLVRSVEPHVGSYAHTGGREEFPSGPSSNPAHLAPLAEVLADHGL